VWRGRGKYNMDPSTFSVRRYGEVFYDENSVEK